MPLLRTLTLIRLLSVALAVSSGRMEPQGFAKSIGREASTGTTRREQIARPLLLEAESTAARLDSGTRALLLYRTAGAWLPLEQARGIRLYREAFAAARISDAGLRSAIEDDILNELLPLSPSSVLDLLPWAEPKTQARLYAGAITFFLFRGDYAGAVRAFDEAGKYGVSPERQTRYLIASLPERRMAERTHVFVAATRVAAERPVQGISYWKLSRTIARFYRELPPAAVLAAIEVVLERSASLDAAHVLGSGTVGSGENSIAYHSVYDLELFAVTPALERLDPERAARLLKEHPEAAGYLKRFPEGLAQFDVADFSMRGKIVPDERMQLGLQLYNKVQEGQTLISLDMGLEFTVPRRLEQMAVVGSLSFDADRGSPEEAVLDPSGQCPDDVAHRLELARAVPISRKVATTCGGPDGRMCNSREDSPRARLLQAMSERCSYPAREAAGHLVLQAALEVLGRMRIEERTNFLASAADIYLRLGDATAAAEVVDKGFEVAAALLKREMLEPALEGRPKAVWLAAETYRRMVTLGVNASLPETQATVASIADLEMREMEEVMLARALLGVPVRHTIVATGGGGLLTGDAEPTYDAL